MQKLTLMWVVLGFGVVHVLLATFVPLVEDEAYYRMWSQVPSLGYYDHPPMIAWWIGASRWMFGDSFLALRFFPILSSALVTVMTYRIGFLLTDGDKRAATLAVFWVNCTPVFMVIGFVATPDAPSVTFWTAALWALVELVSRRNANWWFAAAVFAGVGVQSKFTAFFFGLALVIWLLFSANGRIWLRHWQLWAGGFVALLTMAPLIWWNYSNDWVGLVQQFGRVKSGQISVVKPITFVLSTAMLVSPVLFYLVVRDLRARIRESSLLIWIIGPMILYFTYFSFQFEVNGNWLMPVYPMFALLAALSIKGDVSTRVEKLAGPVGLGLTALALGLATLPGKPVFPGNNPPNQTKGWSALANDVNRAADEAGATWIATGAYGQTALFSYYMSPEIPVWEVLSDSVLIEARRFAFRGQMPKSYCSGTALVVARLSDSKAVTSQFLDVRPLGEISRKSAGVAVMDFKIYQARGVIGHGCQG